MADFWANVNEVLFNYMESDLPEITVIALAKTAKYCFVELAPVVVGYLAFIFNKGGLD